MTKCQNNSELLIIKHKNHAVQACNHAIVHNQVTKIEKELAPETSDPLVIIFPWYWDSILVLPTAPVLSHTHWQCKLMGFDPRLLDPFFHHIPSYSIIFHHIPSYSVISHNIPYSYCFILLPILTQNPPNFDRRPLGDCIQLIAPQHAEGARPRPRGGRGSSC